MGEYWFDFPVTIGAVVRFKAAHSAKAFRNFGKEEDGCHQQSVGNGKRMDKEKSPSS